MKEWALTKILAYCYFKLFNPLALLAFSATLKSNHYVQWLQKWIVSLIVWLRRSSSLLILLTVILLFFELIIPGIYVKLVGGKYDGRNLVHVAFYIGCSILFLLAIPLFLNQIFYREKLQNLGFMYPKKPLETMMLMLLALVVIVPCMIYLAKMPAFQSYYSLNKPSHAKLLFVIVTILPVYYFCEEFFFRGFLFLNLWRRMKWHSFWVTDILFTLGHIGKPFLEIVIALPVGIILALLTLRTKSIYPSMIVHYILGIVMLLVVNQIL